MSTRIGIIAEGPIDHCLLPPLLGRIAREFADDYWKDFARLDDIRAQCPRGYRPFERATTQQFRAASRRAGRLFGWSDGE